MASVSFNLKEPKSKEETLIYLFFSFDSYRLKYSTGEKIIPSQWNAEKQRARENNKTLNKTEFNHHLDLLESTIKDIYRKLINDGIVPTHDLIKKELKLKIKGDTKNKKESLFSFIQELIDNSAKQKNTIKNYKQTLVKLKEFKTFSKRNLDYEDINLSFYNDFTNYLNEKSYSTNTIGGFIKNIKVFMNEAADRGFHKNTEYLNKKFKVIEENTDSIYLNETEILKIYNLDLSENPKLDKVRDLFVIGCYTGLRFSDLEKLTNQNFISNNTQIKVKTEKTGDTIIIPVHRFVKEIYKKYNGQIPKPISNQKMNEYLKELCLKAELFDKVLVSITKGGQRAKDTFQKFQLVSSHTARRSFATNLYLADVPSITIMKITGHRTEKAFLKYIRLTQEQNANKLINHPFFK